MVYREGQNSIISVTLKIVYVVRKIILRCTYIILRTT